MKTTKKSPLKTTKKSPLKQSYIIQPKDKAKGAAIVTQQQRDQAADKSSLTVEERAVIDREGLMRKNGSGWLLDSKLGGEAWSQIRRQGPGSGDDVMNNAYQKQWLKDSTGIVNNRFTDYHRNQSTKRSGDTGQFRSIPYINQENGDLNFKPNFNLNPINMKSPFKMKYGNHK
tara:strand:- start:40 stop:558 length:519 start_codon:yes stop_codon:yes gene_type:complete